MFRSLQILVSPIVLAVSTVGLTACGQQGPLYLPTEPAAATRATLPEILLRAVTPDASTQTTNSPPPQHHQTLPETGTPP